MRSFRPSDARIVKREIRRATDRIRAEPGSPADAGDRFGHSAGLSYPATIFRIRPRSILGDEPLVSPFDRNPFGGIEGRCPGSACVFESFSPDRIFNVAGPSVEGKATKRLSTIRDRHGASSLCLKARPGSERKAPLRLIGIDAASGSVESSFFRAPLSSGMRSVISRHDPKHRGRIPRVARKAWSLDAYASLPLAADPASIEAMYGIQKRHPRSIDRQEERTSVPEACRSRHGWPSKGNEDNGCNRNERQYAPFKRDLSRNEIGKSKDMIAWHADNGQTNSKCHVVIRRLTMGLCRHRRSLRDARTSPAGVEDATALGFGCPPIRDGVGSARSRPPLSSNHRSNP